jgi:hypothetical protein
MRKNILMLILAMPLFIVAQKKMDTVLLKTGQIIGGHIYKMEGDAVYIATGKDSVVYRADEIKTLMFCHQVRSKEPCNASGSSSSSSGSSYTRTTNVNNSSESSTAMINAPSQENIPFSKEKKEMYFKKGLGLLNVTCNQCRGSYTFKLWAQLKDSKTEETINSQSDGNNYKFYYSNWLEPGEYNWSYSDTNNNKAKGTIIIKKGEERNIILFEKEN